MTSGPSGAEVSVVIPCRNSAHIIRSQLDALAREITGRDVEVVVADNGSVDDVADVVAAYSSHIPIRRVDASGRAGVNHARNVGTRNASGAVILLCDADDVVRPGWLDAYLVAVRSGCALVGGRVEPFVDVPGDLLAEGCTRPLEGDAEEVFGTLGFLPYPIGANCGYRREVFDAIGGFDEAFVGGADEIDFFWRAQLAGFQLCHVSDAAVSYRQRVGRRARMDQARLAALGRARLYRKHRTNGWRRVNPIVGYSRRTARLVADLPKAVRGGESLTEWLTRAAALWGHIEAAWRIGAVCP